MCMHSDTHLGPGSSKAEDDSDVLAVNVLSTYVGPTQKAALNKTLLHILAHSQTQTPTPITAGKHHPQHGFPHHLSLLLFL